MRTSRMPRYLGRLPPAARTHPDDDSILWFELAGGEHIGLRPLHPEDRSALVEGFAALSEESRYQRFLAPMDRLTPRQLAYLTDIDQVHHFAWVAGRRDPAGGDEGLGVARYVRLPDDPSTAEVAVVVADDFHGRGLGTLLVHALVPVALDHGVTRLEGYVFAENEPMLRILAGLGGQFAPDAPAVTRATVELARAVPASLTLRACRALAAVARAAARRRRAVPRP